MGKILYDKTGAAFTLDHDHDGVAYVRPMVKVITQSADWGEGPIEEEDYEPAAYLVAINRAELFNAPPVAAVNADIAAKLAELDALKSEVKKAERESKEQRSQLERQLHNAKRQLDDWMATHRVMMELGKLLDGQVLYPLSVRKNSYHHSREIPLIPNMRHAQYLSITSGDFEKGQKWVCKQYGSDSYGSPFRFYDTEEERASVIRAEFDETCNAFRRSPNFDTTSWTTSTALHYGTLMAWVKTHPSLAIPNDILALKAKHDADLVAQRKAHLAAELAAIEGGAA